MKHTAKPRIENIEVNRVENGFHVHYYEHKDTKWYQKEYRKRREYVFADVQSLNTWLKENFA